MKPTGVLAPFVQIVVAKVEETQEGRVYAGRPWGPQRTVRVARAAMWLRKGSDFSIGAANRWADDNGYQVFTYDLSERDPLGRAKTDILAIQAEGGDR